MRKFVVMSGGFHPFHAGHASLYQQAKQAFPDATILVCATNVQSKRPFPFSIKQKLAKLSGVPENDFIEVSRQFSIEDPSLAKRIGDPNDAAVIFVRSDKDKNEPPIPWRLGPDGKPPVGKKGPKKGLPLSNRLLDYPSNGQPLEPASKHVYMDYLKTVEFGPGITSASEIRAVWPKLDEKRKLAMVYSLYPETQKNSKLAKIAIKLLDMGMEDGQVTEEKNVENPTKEVDPNAEFFISGDPESEEILKYAQVHYPGARSKQRAFIKFVQRALKHSEEDDLRQNQEINRLQSDIRDIKNKIQKIDLSENKDYLDEK